MFSAHFPAEDMASEPKVPCGRKSKTSLQRDGLPLTRTLFVPIARSAGNLLSGKRITHEGQEMKARNTQQFTIQQRMVFQAWYDALSDPSTWEHMRVYLEENYMLLCDSEQPTRGMWALLPELN